MAKLTLGPLLFNWPAEKRRDFYFRIADEAPVDTVHLGEVVCAKREPFIADLLPVLVERLQRGGKEVAISTLALVMNAREAAALREIVADGALLVEANDMAAVALLAGRPHLLGPTINVYNEGTLAWLAGRGARRVCLPIELSAPAIAALAGSGACEIEVFAFGRAPLAISARCYHARAHGLAKDGCRYVCGDDADGMAAETIEGQPFLAVNGTQTLSHACVNLLREASGLRDAGVRRFRLSPHDIDMVAVARAFRDVLDGQIAADVGWRRLGELAPHLPFANGFLHGIAGASLVAAE
jgi:collagenase-like PrtC family protease